MTLGNMRELECRALAGLAQDHETGRAGCNEADRVMKQIQTALRNIASQQRTIVLTAVLIFAHAWFRVKPGYRSDVLAGFGGAL